MTQNVLQQSVILLTGAAGGFGRAAAMQLQAQGARMILLDKDRRGLEQVFDQMVESAPDQPSPSLYPLDLIGAGPEDYSELAERIEDEFGRLDAVIHAAARFDGLTPLEHVSPDFWLATLQANVSGPWALSRACLPLLKKGSSTSAMVFVLEDQERVSQALWGAYGVSKIAMQTMAGQWAQELEDSQVAVVRYYPGPMATQLRSTAFHAEPPDAQKAPQVAATEMYQLLLEALGAEAS